MSKTKGPQFLKFCIPLVEVLKELGSSGQPKEVTDAVIEHLNISEAEQSQTLKNGSSRIRNQIAWARFYLVKADFLDASRRGIWALTEKGRTTTLTQDIVIQLFKDVQVNLPTKDKQSSKAEEDTENNPPLELSDKSTSKLNLLKVLKSLSPGGFERLTQLLLRESGFERVFVTGKSNDGGIDGHGILQINSFVSFTVLFQCKRYSGAVSSPQIRDFRGAMVGRADKGIIITTGTFTTEATKEARRDGAPPIELVDGEKLVELFEKLQLGVTPKTIYEVDESFFEDYR
jgi:restriction system protein